MKVLYFFIVGILLVSCSNSYNISEFPQKSNSLLLSKLSAFNDSLKQKRTETRGFVKPGAWKRAQVIAADCAGAWSCGEAGLYVGGLFSPAGSAVGATIGAIIGGACGSYTAYASLYWTRTTQLKAITPEDVTLAYADLITDENINFYDEKPKKIIANYPNVDENVSLMGAKHNLLLKKLLTEDYGKVISEDVLSEDEIKIIQSSCYRKAYEDTMLAISKNEGILKLDGDDVGNKLMNLFYDIFQNYSDNSDDVQFLINKYIEAVNESSELSEEVKNIVYSSLSVIASSYEFWESIKL